MRIAVLKEHKAGEARCAISPDMVKRYVELGADVVIQRAAGEASGISNEAYEAAGASIMAGSGTTAKDADIVLCVNMPDIKTLEHIPNECVLVGMLDPFHVDPELLNEKRLTAFSMELLPRISRAQSMDVLSSQSNLAGYRAVIEAVAAMGKATPMFMTAAGTVAPAKALILGAGVSGLQAIATAKRLGCAVSAFDVRPEVKEQVESLGAKFVEVKNTESGSAEGGYAKEMSAEYKQKQSELIAETLKKQHLCITTALIPGREAPELITDAMVQDMMPGSVIVDMAVAAGGNYKGSQEGKIVEKHGVKIIGYSDLPSRVAADATPLYARNLFNFVSALLINKEQKALDIQWDDELVAGTLLTKDGEVVHQRIAEARGLNTKAPEAASQPETAESDDE
ncbi:MAG: NAD(P)(+) transhydrogenase (Re/Si-specific) subunit alpha [Rickettsiales bacterium]|nr:NAD(P)(+) transhydrogenase (Re/Si-specific) subunit alpha [Rickettsiales bacterium]|tara:strand:- start:76 stop:1266 length:1191 start_codon:yes stop_codon:yes gene_type:complete